jgi:hypothetical protein
MRYDTIDGIIYWVRSWGSDGDELVPMYYKGRCDRRDEGRVGHDIKARPVTLGLGEYTATYGALDFKLQPDDGDTVIDGEA